MPAQQVLRAGTRQSQLARWQADYVISRLKEAWPKLQYEVLPFETRGDKAIDYPLPQIGGKGLFTAELEGALLSGEIDIAVHSLKDLPVENPPGLILGAILERGDVRDALVARNADSLGALEPGAIVGTSSLRRQAQLLAVHPDLRVRSIRGNVETRVRKVQDGEYDAAILAAAGLQRLNMAHVAGAWLPLDVMLPAPGQGALAVQCRAGDDETLALLQTIDCQSARRSTTAERRFLQALGGGCSAPIAAYARTGEDGALSLDGLIASPSGGAVVRVSGSGNDPYELAADLAAQALDQGADRILTAITALGSTPRRLPLSGRCVVITRPRAQAAGFAAHLRRLGAEPILFPAIRIVPAADTRPLDAAIRRLREYDWVIFTSVNGVDVFWQRLDALGFDAGQFDGVRVAAIGPATGAALSNFGIAPHFTPDEFVAEGIAEGIGHVQDQKILLPRAEQARPALAKLLRDGGACVDEVASYQTVAGSPDDKAHAALAMASVITFTSASTVRNFVSLVGGPQAASQLVSRAVVACIGPITAETAREMGIDAQIVAEDYTTDGLIEALLAYYRQGRNSG